VTGERSFQVELLDDVPARRDVDAGGTPRRSRAGDGADDRRRRRGHASYQGMVEPPLGRITIPVTNFAAGDAR